MPRLLNVRPRGGGRLVLGLLPILLMLLVYVTGATARHAVNPSDKILPTLAAMAEQVHVMGFQTDPQTGNVPLVVENVPCTRTRTGPFGRGGTWSSGVESFSSVKESGDSG